MYFINVQILSKSILALFIGIFGLLVGIDNILDYGTNYQFVHHVLGMDTMETWFSNSPILMHRAITNLTLQSIFYNCIIWGELVTGALFLAGAILLFVSIFKRSKIELAKSLCVLGCILAMAIWYFGFDVIGGEYFSMWANTFNGQMKAYVFATFILIAMIYIILKEYSYNKSE